MKSKEPVILENVSIAYNQPIIQYDVDALFDRYDVFLIKNGGYVSRAHSFLDGVEMTQNVISLWFSPFQGESKCYVLLRKNASNQITMRKIMQVSQEKDTITCERVPRPIVSDHLEKMNPELDTAIKGLLINATNINVLIQCDFSNTSGRLFYIIPEKTKQDEYLTAIEINFSQETGIELNVKSFTSRKYEKKHPGCIVYTSSRHKNFDSYPFYKYDADTNVLRRWRDGDKGEPFIERRADHLPKLGKKTECSYIKINSMQELEASKAGILLHFIREFNLVHEGLAEIKEWKTLPIEKRWKLKETATDLRKKLDERILEIIPVINLTDVYGDEEFNAAVTRALKGEKNKKNTDKDPAGKTNNHVGYLDENIKRTSVPAFNGLPTIAILPHDEEYYTEANAHDPYFDFEQPVQHINASNPNHYDKNGNPGPYNAVRSSLVSLAIKKDIASHQITLYDWSSLGFQNSCSFYTAKFKKTKDSDGKEKAEFSHFETICIEKDGEIHFGNTLQKEQALISNDDIRHLESMLFDDYRSALRGVKCAFKDENGHFMLIRDTAFYTVPDIVGISDYYGQVKKMDSEEPGHKTQKVRTEVYREKYLSPILDFGYGRKEDHLLYYVGVVGNGMQSTVQNTSHIREVIPEHAGDEDGFIQLFPAFANVFARYGQLSAYPFPMRYLNEYDDMLIHQRKITKA